MYSDDLADISIHVELKPCPFCGAKGDVYKRDMSWEDNRMIVKNGRWTNNPIQYTCERWVADCSKCDCVVGEYFHTAQDAINAWNGRA